MQDNDKIVVSKSEKQNLPPIFKTEAFIQAPKEVVRIFSIDPLLIAGKEHHVVVNIDGGPRIISYIIDGRCSDGGETRQFGWGRFSSYLRHVNGGDLRIAPEVAQVRVYGRVLLTCEAVARYLH